MIILGEWVGYGEIELWFLGLTNDAEVDIERPLEKGPTRATSAGRASPGFGQTPAWGKVDIFYFDIERGTRLFACGGTIPVDTGRPVGGVWGRSKKWGVEDDHG